jgi:hypothetical protein
MFEEIFKISNYPYLQPDGDLGQKVLRVFKTYGLMMLFLIASGPILILTDKFVTAVLHHKSLNLGNRELFRNMHKKLGLINSILFICLIGPVFEELIFRLPLAFTRRRVAIGLLIAIFYASGAAYHPKILMLKVVLEIAIALVITGACYFFIPDTPLSLSPGQKARMIIFSIMLFGLMHISNYRPFDISLLWIYPVYVIPQLLMGWGISYVRLKNGFIWGIALHCIINTVSTLLSFWVK